MTNLLKSHYLYKLIVIVFLAFAVSNLRTQLITLNSYNREIGVLNDKISTLKEQTSSKNADSELSKEDNENIARRDLKMYYPNETPYKGF